MELNVSYKNEMKLCCCVFRYRNMTDIFWLFYSFFIFAYDPKTKKQKPRERLYVKKCEMGAFTKELIKAI